MKKQAIAALAAIFMATAASSATPILVHRDPGCGCCEKWAAQIRMVCRCVSPPATPP